MINNRLLRRTALTHRGGFTLVELLVVIGIIAILAGVALGPITRGIKQAQESASMQTCRQIGLMEFAYSNDNSQTYPFGKVSEDIANLLLNGSYSSDPNNFYIAATPSSAKPVVPAAGSAYALTKGMCSYDFMVNSGATTPGGLTSTAADGTPLVELTGATVKMATTGPISATLTPANCLFGSDGIAVAYKSNSAVFLKFALSSSGVSTTASNPYVSASYSDPSGAGYALIIP